MGRQLFRWDPHSLIPLPRVGASNSSTIILPHEAIRDRLFTHDPAMAPTVMEPAAFSMRALIGDAVGLLDALGIESAAVVGHDWGAALAWSLARCVPTG